MKSSPVIRTGTRPEGTPDYSSGDPQATPYPYGVIPEGTMHIAPQIRANRILQDAEILRQENLPLFQDVVKNLSEKADSLTGEQHPLAAILKQKPSQESIDRLEEGMAEYRKAMSGATPC